MANFLAKLFGTKSDRDLKQLGPIKDNVLAAYEVIKDLTNDELREKTVEFKNIIHESIEPSERRIAEIKRELDENFKMEISEKESLYKEMERLEKESYKTTEEVLNSILQEAIAVMKETARRFKGNEIVEVTATQMDRDIAAYRDCIEIVGAKALYHNSWTAGGNLIKWDMCHYDVQLIGGTVLHQGKIAEMATGEGKTLVATLAVYLNALPGKGVHIGTVNDYLAKRDSEWMGLLYEFHGLTIDCIDKHEPNSRERRQAYLADVTYGTNNEFGFDYLRDNMARNLDELVQRPHNFAIVDEVDSVLIDDARTPLIISGPTPRGDQQDFDRYKPNVEKLYNAQKLLVSELLPQAKKAINDNPEIKPTELGAQLLLRCHRGLPKNKALIKFLSEPNIKNILLRTEAFYMAEQNRNMFIIDNDLTTLDDETNEKIHKYNQRFEHFNKLMGNLDNTANDSFKKEADAFKKELEHFLEEIKRQVSDHVRSEDAYKFAKSFKNVAISYQNMSLLSNQDKESAEDDSFAAFRNMMTSTVQSEIAGCEHGNDERKKTLEEFLEIMQKTTTAENVSSLQEFSDVPFGKYGLNFVIEEKLNSVNIMERGIEVISRNTEEGKLFIIPDIGSEIAKFEKKNLPPHELAEKKADLYRDFSIASERIHTVQQLLKAYTMFEKDVEYVIIDNKVKIVDEQTGRIMEGRRYSDGLHQAIEAKENVKVEAATQTYATITLQNYFRMYKKLSGMTGTAPTAAGELSNIYKLDVVVIPTNRPISRKDMEDRLFKTKREKYQAVIDEIVKLVGEGRPVLVGTTSVEISELLSKMLTMRKIQHNVLNAKLHQREADIVAQAGMKSSVTIATNMAGRGTDIKLSAEVKAAGGLAIIGTERHESRRVDRQLRGRAGRQGDPGSSVFYVSLEDNLMRLFGTERIAGIMDRMKFEEGEMIENHMISKSIERAQRKVEENNFGIRKRLLEYDDVMNNQREVIYTKRRHALMGERISIDIMNSMYDLATLIVENAESAKDYEMLVEDVRSYFAMDIPYDEETFTSSKSEKNIDTLFDAVLLNFKRRTEKMATVANPVVQQVYERQGAMYENILIPITDGKRTYNIPVNLKLAAETQSKEVVRSFEKAIMLHTIDEAWKENLRELDDLRTSVQNASYEQKDPLLIYKLESYNLFKTMIDGVNRKTIAILMRGQIPVREPEAVQEAAPERKPDTSRYRAQKDDYDEA